MNQNVARIPIDVKLPGNSIEKCMQMSHFDSNLRRLLYLFPWDNNLGVDSEHGENQQEEQVDDDRKTRHCLASFWCF